MVESKQSVPTTGLEVHDILRILFKHKWKILVSAVAGFAAAAGFYFSRASLFETEAKVLVRYIVDRSAIDPVDSPTASISVRASNDSLMNSEVEILTSVDLAMQVAETIGVERVLPGSKGVVSKADAAQRISSGLKVTSLRASNIIWVSYTNNDPQLAALILDKLIAEYFIKHLEVHRDAGTINFVTQQSDLIRNRLAQTDAELKRLMGKAGILSLRESASALTAELAKSQEELHIVEAELAEQTARVRDMEKSLGRTGVNSVDVSQSSSGGVLPSDRAVRQYEALIVRLAQLRQTELDFLSKYTPGNPLVTLKQTEIENLERQRRDLEKQYPAILASAPSQEASQGHLPDLVSEGARLAGIVAKAETLKSQLITVEEKVAKHSEIAPQIAQLERNKELEEGNLKYISASLEKARTDGLLDPSKMPNISLVQKPSTAKSSTKARDKIVFGLAGGGLALGLVMALLIEFVFDRSVKRPAEIENRLRIPVLVSIPAASAKTRLRRHLPNDGNDSDARLLNTTSLELDPREHGHFIRPFTEALRDRLVLHFQLNKVAYNPKLVAVTGCAGGEGVSTVAAGLAAALSETGDGKILLVDMNEGRGQVHRLFEGKQTSALIDAIDGSSTMPAVAENLYLAKASVADGTSQIIPKRVYDLVPHFKATDFDYIIFDMPPLVHSTIALAMAGFMDKVILVVEAEKSGLDAVRRSHSELVAARADVSIVVNKTRSYGPKWVES